LDAQRKVTKEMRPCRAIVKDFFGGCGTRLAVFLLCWRMMRAKFTLAHTVLAETQKKL
jgi:hypothetical protein